AKAAASTSSPMTRSSAPCRSRCNPVLSRTSRGPRRQRRGPFRFRPSAQVKIHRGHHPDLLERGVGHAPPAAIAVAAGDLEIALGRLLDAADAGFAVLGELFGRGAGILG